MLSKLFRKFAHEEAPGDLLARGHLPPTQVQWLQLAQSHRLSSLLAYESFDEGTELFYCGESYGFMLEVGTATGLSEDALNVLANLYTNNSLRPGTTIQVTLYASPAVLPILRTWAASRLPDQQIGPAFAAGMASGSEDEANAGERRQENLFRRLVRRRVDYLSKGSWSSLLSDQPMLLRDFRLLVSVTRPLDATGKPEPMDLENTLRLRSAMKGTLRSAGLESVVMGEESLLALMEVILNPRLTHRDPPLPQPELLLREQMVDLGTRLLVGRDGLHLSGEGLDVDVRTFTVREFPRAWAGWGMGQLIGSLTDNNRRLPCPFLVTVTATYPDQLNAASAAKMKATRATQMADSEMGKFLPSWAEKREEWNFVVQKLAEGHTLAKVAYQVVLFAKQGEGDFAEHQLYSLYRSAGWRLSKIRFTPLPAFLSCLPLHGGPKWTRTLEAVHRQRTFLSWTVTNISPFIGEWKGTGSPLLLLIGRRGQLLYFSPWDNVQGNYNVAVAAASGSGKSFFTNETIVAVLGTGGRVWAFDRGRSYEKLCLLLGGTFIEFSGESRIGLNPFTHIRNWDGDDETGSERIMLKSLIATMASPSRPLDPMQLGWIEQALQHVWSKRRNEACITDLYDYLKAQEDPRKGDLADALYSYTRHGFYGSYFDGPSNVDLDHDFVVLEMQELDAMPALQAVVLLLLVMRITQTMYIGGDRSIKKLLLIDEAWKLMGPNAGNAGEFIEEAARTVRKFQGCLMTITQGVNDYYKSGTAQAALENSDHTILLRQKKESVDQLAKTDRLPAGEESLALVKSLHTIHGAYSEMAIISPSGMAVGRLIVDPFSEKLYSTKGEEFQAIKEMVRSGISLADAVEKLAAKVKR